MAPGSCVSCVSWWCSVNAAETHETVRAESGMRYQLSYYIWWFMHKLTTRCCVLSWYRMSVEPLLEPLSA